MKELDFKVDFTIRKNDLIAEIPMIGTTKGLIERRSWSKTAWSDKQELVAFFDDVKEELLKRIL
jgi:hypothetical protein